MMMPVGVAFSIGLIVFPSSSFIQGLNLCDGGAIGVAPFLKVTRLDFRHGFEVSFSGCALLLGAWLMRGGGSCNMKSELLRRGVAW